MRSKGSDGGKVGVASAGVGRGVEVGDGAGGKLDGEVGLVCAGVGTGVAVGGRVGTDVDGGVGGSVGGEVGAKVSAGVGGVVQPTRVSRTITSSTIGRSFFISFTSQNLSFLTRRGSCI
jgi:hypothetical protein